MSLGCLAVNMTPLLPSESLPPGGGHGWEIMKRDVPRESAIQMGVPRGMGSGKASWKRGHLLRPTGGVELTRERQQKLFQAEWQNVQRRKKRNMLYSDN